MSALSALAGRAQKSDFVRHGLLVFSALMAANVLQFAFYLFVSRVVGVEQYGVFQSLFSAILLIAIAPSTVAATIVARLCAELAAVDDNGKLRRLGDVITIATAIVGLGAFVVVDVLAGPIANYLHLATTTPVIVAGVALALTFALPVQRGVFQGTQRFSAFAISNIVEAAAKVIAGPLLGMRFGTDGVLWGLSLASCLAWVYNVIVLRRFGAPAARLTLDVRRIVITSVNVAVAICAINALIFYDVIIVRHYFTALTAGLYGAAALVGRAVYTVIAFLPTVVLPKASARSSLGRGTTSLLAAALGTGGAIVGVAIFACWLQPRMIVSILAGRAFADAGAFELAYVVALGALALANVIAMYKIGLHRFDFVLPLAVVATAEIAAVIIRHNTIFEVLTILCVGHSLALGSTLFGVTQPVRSSVGHVADGQPVKEA